MSRYHRTRQFLLGVGLAAVLASLGCRTNPDVAKQEYKKSGDRYVEQQKYAEAIVQYRNALQQDPKFGEARYKLAEAYAQTGDVRNAYREYIRAADLLPDNVDAQVKAAGLLFLARQFEDAKTRAQKALARDPKNVQAQIILGNALAGLNDFDAAIKQLEEANKLQPTVGGFASIGAIKRSRGDMPEAEKAFRAAVAVDPKNIGGLLALSNYLLAAGRGPEAETSLKDALALDPTNALANRALIALLASTGRAREAEPYLKRLAESDKSPAAGYKITLAEYFAQTNRVDDALKILTPLAGAKESFAPSQSRVAIIHFARKEKAQAYQTIDGVLQRDPKNPEALVTKTRFLLADGKLDEALKTAQTATAADPQAVGAFYLVGVIQRLRRQPAEAIAAFNEVIRLNPQAVAAQLELSQLNNSLGKTQAGLQMAEDAAKALPGNPVVQLNLAKNLVAQRQFSRAEPMIRDLVAKYPNASSVHAAAGMLALAKNDLAGARKEYDKAIALEPLNLGALTGLTAIDVTQKNLPAARARIDAALAKSPDDAELLILAGRTYASVGDQTASEAAFKKAIEKTPQALAAYSLLGRLYLTEQKLDQALVEFDRLTGKDPTSVGAPTMSGIILEMQGKRDEARKRYERALQIDPNAPVAANNLAYMYAETGGNLDLALQLAQTARQKLPDMPQVGDTLGYVYLKKELPALAIAPLEASVEKDPNNSIFQYHLGLAYAMTGERTKARSSLQQALALSPRFEGADDARRVLSTLQ